MGRIEVHNREVVTSAQYRASQMTTWPSPLEEKMKRFLDSNHIEYECQKVFYIYADDGWIERYYIADFFIPKINLIIEVDGKFHDKQRHYDKNRTKKIQEKYPDVEVVRFDKKDLSDSVKMSNLLFKIQEVL